MNLNLAPWYYRNLLGENKIIEEPEFYNVCLRDGRKCFETSITLKKDLRPVWLNQSNLYRNSDGSGTSEFKNIAVYKGISEALERWAFYTTVDTEEKKYCYDLNPTTTGMAAYPHISANKARANAKLEAIERWAIHEFNRNSLPIIEHATKIENLRHFELVTPFKNIIISLIEYWNGEYFCYGFSGDNDLKRSFEHALVELDRNFRVLSKAYPSLKTYDQFENAVDRTLFYFSSIEGNECFKELISNAPSILKNKEPRILCDKEVMGEWSSYTRVWRYLLEESYYDCRLNHKFFMF